MAIKEISTNLEAFWMFNRSGKEARPSSQINQAEISPGSGIDEEEVGTLTWDDKKPKKKGSINSLKRGIRCFNWRKEGHGIKECQSPKNPCVECKFLGGGHQAKLVNVCHQGPHHCLRTRCCTLSACSP